MQPLPLPLRTHLEALGGLVIEVRGDLATAVRGACADSRQVQPGDLFCAIPGSREDGGRFVAAAVQAGACAVVSTRAPDATLAVPQVRVSDAYAAAGRLAECAAGYPARRLCLLGVTGTNGKTTCAYLLRHMLRRHGWVTGMVGTVCYDLGDHEITAERTTPTPFELQGLFTAMGQGGCTHTVLEMSSHALAQRRAGTARFAGAIFTNLTGDHLDYHKTMEAYFEAKALLFDEYLEAGGVAVVNTDDASGRRLALRLGSENRARLVTVGGRDAEVSWSGLELGFGGSRFRLHLGGEGLDLDSPLIGRHNVSNLACTAALAWARGVPGAAIAAAVQSCRGAPGRLQVIASPQGFSAYVDYAHSDDALANVLRALRLLQPRRLLVVFGCGGDRDRSKRPRMGAVAAQLADRVYVTSDNPRTEEPSRIIAEILTGSGTGPQVWADPDRRQAIRAAVAEARPGDLILVAGKGHETYQEIQGEKHPFDDVREVRLAMGLPPDA